MIDKLEKAEDLIDRMMEVLPLPVILPPPLIAHFPKRRPEFDPPQRCNITSVAYTGDEAGIVCELDFGDRMGEVFLISITHLAIAPGAPLAREITAYQKHRIKRLRRQNELRYAYTEFRPR